MVFAMTERNSDDDAWLSPQQVAAIMGVTDRTILRYIEDSVLPAVRLPGGRLWRIRRVDVDALMATEAAS